MSYYSYNSRRQRIKKTYPYIVEIQRGWINIVSKLGTICERNSIENNAFNSEAEEDQLEARCDV